MKKITAIILAAILLLAVSLPASAYIIGDPDNDFEVTTNDARFALRLAVGLIKCDKNSDQFKAADADGNGTVTTGDARIILRTAVGLEKFPENTAVYGNIIATKMPYTTNGLTINSLFVDEYGCLVLSITNNTAKTNMAVNNGSYIPYKLYNSAGKIIDYGKIFVSKMNPGESCSPKKYIDDSTAKIVFGAATVHFTDLIPSNETTVINGITVTKPPFEKNGIIVNSITIDKEENKLTAVVTNNTNKALYGYVDFLSYDAKGHSLDTESVTTQHLNPGEKGIDYFFFSPETAKIIFTNVKCYEHEAFVPISIKTADFNGVAITEFPINFKGVSINFQKIDNIYGIPNRPAMFLKITNNTNKAINQTFEFLYKEYDANGYVISCTHDSIHDLEPGESKIFTSSLHGDASKILFGNFNY